MVDSGELLTQRDWCPNEKWRHRDRHTHGGNVFVGWQTLGSWGHKQGTARISGHHQELGDRLGTESGALQGANPADTLISDFIRH